MSFNSQKYWENRYKKGGNSGGGSYNKLAQFKADILNNFIKTNYEEINYIIDYGVGDGNQLKYLNIDNIKYLGIDVSKTVINKCINEFSKDNNKSFLLYNNNILKNIKGDLVLSCDVLYHLIEDNIFYNYINNMFNISNKFVIIYAKDENFNKTKHVKFRKFTDYINNNYINWKLINHIPNKYPETDNNHNVHEVSPSDFYIYKKKII